MTSLTSGMQQLAKSRNVTEMAIDWRNRRLEHMRAENWRSDAGADCNTTRTCTNDPIYMYISLHVQQQLAGLQQRGHIQGTAVASPQMLPLNVGLEPEQYFKACIQTHSQVDNPKKSNY